MEKLVIHELLKEKKLFDKSIIQFPDPPDCVFESTGKTGWIEVTSIYRHFKECTYEKKPYGTCKYEFSGTHSHLISLKIIAPFYHRK